MGAAPKADLEKSVCHLAHLCMILALAAMVTPPIEAQPAPEAGELQSYGKQRNWGLGNQVRELGAPLGASDERGRERFRWQCQNELGRREVTLFGNGTVRLRSGLWENPQLHLDELGPDELHAYLERLSTIQRSRSFPQIAERLSDFQGLWNQTCELHLELPDLPIRQFYPWRAWRVFSFSCLPAQHEHRQIRSLGKIYQSKPLDQVQDRLRKNAHSPK